MKVKVKVKDLNKQFLVELVNTVEALDMAVEIIEEYCPHILTEDSRGIAIMECYESNRRPL